MLPSLHRNHGLPYLEQAGSPSVIYLGCLTAFPMFIALLSGSDALSAVLRVRPLQFMGTISYNFCGRPSSPIRPKIVCQKVLEGRVSDSLIMLIFASASLIASLVISTLSFHYLEEGARRAFRRWRDTRHTKAVAA